MKKFVAAALFCLLAAAIGAGGMAALAEPSEDRFVTSGPLDTVWNGASNFVSQDNSAYDAVNASYDAAAPHAYSFNEGGYIISSQPFAQIGDGIAVDWYFNMKGAGYGEVETLPELGFAAVTSKEGEAPYAAENAARIIFGQDGVRAEGTDAGGSLAVTSGADQKIGDLYELNNWESNIQLRVRFVPSENRIELQRCKTAVDGNTFHVVAEVENIAIPAENVYFAMYLAAGDNLTVTHWALPALANTQLAASDYAANYTGTVTGNDAGIYTRDALSLRENDTVVMEMDIVQAPVAGDWIGIALGRNTSLSGSAFGNQPDSLTVYYGAAGGGTQVSDANLGVIGWVEHSYPVSEVFAAGRHIRAEWNLGAGTYELVSSAEGGEDIVHTLEGLQFSSFENVHMGFVADSSVNIGVSDMHFYTVKERVELIVRDLIAAIGEVTLSEDCRGKIEAAREAYDALTAEEQALVTNYEVLTAAEAAYKSLADNAAADGAKTLIAAIGTVEYTPECRERIEAAREAYDLLTADQQALVENYALLTAAEEEYAELEAQLAASAVEELIGAIGEVDLTAGCKARIDAARSAYDELTEEQRAQVGNYAVLTAAEAEYSALLSAVQEAAEAADALISAIGTVEYTEACAEKIAAAREAYEALSPAAKELAQNLPVLEAAEAEYARLRSEAQVDEAEALISAIGTVEYTAACKEKIDAARKAYEALTDEQRAEVGNYGILEAAENDYRILEQLAEQAAADKAAAAAVDELISAIGTVEYSDACKAKIDAAREAYEALTSAQKGLVTGIDALTAAEEEYADRGAASAADALISAIGTVEYSDACKAKIDAARAAYDALSPAQREYVTRLSVLEEAEASYRAAAEEAQGGKEDEEGPGEEGQDKGGCSSSVSAFSAAFAVAALAGAAALSAVKGRKN